MIMSVAVMMAAAGGATAETLLERGSYLVNAVMACDGCHTPRPGGVFDMSRRFSGGSQVWDEKAYTVRGSNITPDRETGIGTWSEADLKRALTEGVRPSGVHLAPQMPFAFYKIMTPHDLDAVVAYIRSVEPVRHQVPPPVYKAEAHAVLIPDAEKPIADDALRDPVKRGFYLATIAHCMECHSRRPDGTQDYVNWNGRGEPNSPARSARSMPATSPRIRPRGSAPGPTPRSNAPSRTASRVTAGSSSRRWRATSISPR
jgi:mono/diheme cytochrome c family protein